MKRTTIFLAALTIVVGSALANGDDDKKQKADFVFFQGKNNVYQLIYPSKEKGKVKISFKSDNGKTLESYSISNQYGFKKPFDLSQLSPGDYSVEVEDASGLSSLNFSIGSGIKMAAFKQNGTYRLITENKSGSGFTVNIYDEKNSLVHSQKHTEGFSRKYDLTALGSTQYTFQVVQNGRSQSIAVK